MTNKVNSKIYIGVRSSHKPPEKDSYLGSGVQIVAAIKKYGKENFTKEILQTFSDKESMFLAEASIVDTDFAKRRDTYNMCVGGSGGDKMSLHPDRENYIKKISNTMKNQMLEMTDDERSKKFGNHGESNPFFGKKHTPELQEKYRLMACKFEYTLTSPKGENFKTKSLNQFCKEQGINRDILMKYIDRGIIPVPRNYGNETRMKTVGWSITRT